MRWLGWVLALFLSVGTFFIGRRYEQRADRAYWLTVIGDQCEDCERIGRKEGYLAGYRVGLKAAFDEIDADRRR